MNFGQTFPENEMKQKKPTIYGFRPIIDIFVRLLNCHALFYFFFSFTFYFFRFMWKYKKPIALFTFYWVEPIKRKKKEFFEIEWKRHQYNDARLCLSFLTCWVSNWLILKLKNGKRNEDKKKQNEKLKILNGATDTIYSNSAMDIL